MTLWKTHTTELDPISSKYILKTSNTLFNGSVFNSVVLPRANWKYENTDVVLFYSFKLNTDYSLEAFSIIYVC